MGVCPIQPYPKTGVMKKVLWICFALGLAFHAFSQQGLHPVVSATKMNVVYRGIANPIEIAVPGYTWRDLEVVVDPDHLLECNETGVCFLTPSNDFDVRALKVQASISSESGEKTVLDPVSFRIKRIPDPELIWAGRTAQDDVIHRASMLSFAPVAARMSDFDFDVGMKVVTFWLGVERRGEFRYFRSDDPFLTEEMKQALVMTGPGDRVWLGNAYVSMPDGTERELPPLLLTLKD